MRTLKPSSKNNLLRSYNSSEALEFNESPIILKKESSFKPNNSHSPEKQLNPFVDHRYFQPFKDIVPLRQQEFEKLPDINTKSSRNIVFSHHLKNMLHSQQNISILQSSPKKKTIMQLLGQSSSNEIFLLDTQPTEQTLHKEKSTETTLDNIVTSQLQQQLQHQSSRFFKMNSMEINFNNQSGNVQQEVQDQEEETEAEEEYHIWDNQFYQGIGLDIDSNFESNNLLNFVQLFYVRSQLYQEGNVIKADILDEIKVISAMSNVDVNQLQCSKQIDQMEHKYNISLKKNAQQVAKLSLIPRRRYLCPPTQADSDVASNGQNINYNQQQFKHSRFLPMNSSQMNLSPPSKILKNRPYPEQLIIPDGQKSNLFQSESNGRFGMTQFNSNNNLQHLSNQQNQLFRICSQNNLGQPSQQEIRNKQEESTSPLLRDKKKAQMKAQFKLNASKGFFQKRKVQIDVNNFQIKQLSNSHMIRNHTTHQEQTYNPVETKNNAEIKLFKQGNKKVGQICQIPSSEYIQTNIYV